MKETVIMYTPTGCLFENRKEAKKELGHSKYNKAVKSGEIVIITTHGFGSIII